MPFSEDAESVMKRTISIIFSVLAVTIWASAQTFGHIEINQPEALDSLVQKRTDIKESSNNQCVTSSGFRVQLYSSNRNQIAKKGAFKAEEEFTELFPDVKAYVTFSAPFWKVRIGDFSSYYEALLFSNKLKDAFPERATEIFVVKEDNIKPIYLNPQENSQNDSQDATTPI